MKRLALTLMALLMPAALGAQGIDGSKHDFSGKSWNQGGTGEICVVCHAAHDAATLPAAPLWNHDLTGATFIPYTGPGTLDASVGQPDGVSALCLSCHDGTVAVDSYGGKTGTDFISGGDLIGTDLSNDHPISFTFNTALATADGGLHDPSSVNSGLGGTISADMLFSGQMECASCHDVHDADGNSKLLVKLNTGSALCLTCHNK